MTKLSSEIETKKTIKKLKFKKQQHFHTHRTKKLKNIFVAEVSVRSYRIGIHPCSPYVLLNQYTLIDGILIS
jgi:hypothetical protein